MMSNAQLRLLRRAGAAEELKLDAPRVKGSGGMATLRALQRLGLLESGRVRTAILTAKGKAAMARELAAPACHFDESAPLCTCGHVRDEHADDRHECAAFDPGDEHESDVPCACIMFDPAPPAVPVSRKAGES